MRLRFSKKLSQRIEEIREQLDYASKEHVVMVAVALMSRLMRSEDKLVVLKKLVKSK